MMPNKSSNIKTSLYLVLILLTLACNKRIATDEQFARYESYQKVLTETKELLPFAVNQNDSAMLVMIDIVNLNLHDLIEKHSIGKNEIDSLLNTLAITVQIVTSYRRLNSPTTNHAIKESSENRSNSESKFTFENVIIDTSKQKVVVRSYDSSAKK
ncbi:MAG TPA: hypothetical protein PK637_10545 [Flavobacteriales bacterium]|uniref:hypothetical protein n=1 Tax=uncultured Flavobacterium sp. TaxID=165435 RepID=UPI000E9E6E71|nr:hypothetical protein [uncultured Flavobacterium sp.]HBI00299.1 hypothetical protein [Flavobacterium sp.]HRE75557.1 hypothetical protein [Flavobacteriales bacterium]HRE97196.1 hypothetical protein [Flavobacteriales bacterium]HRJ38690.1 hypothetical protein [Flavobacteriales bacterium]